MEEGEAWGNRKTVKLKRFHRQLFFFSEILYLHKVEESTNTLLRRQNHYSTFNLNTGRTIDAKHRGQRYLHGEKKKKSIIKAPEIKSRR